MECVGFVVRVAWGAPPWPGGLCAPCPPAFACGYGLLLYLRAKASRPRQGSAWESAGLPLGLSVRPRELWSAGRGCPPVVSKGGGGGRRPTPWYMEAGRHPRPVPRRRINAHSSMIVRHSRKRPPRGWPFSETVVGKTGFEPATSTSRT